MLSKILPLLIFSIATMTVSVVNARELSSQDRIVFLGDSITQAGIEPGGYVDLVKQSLLESTDLKGIEVLGAGISGNRVPDIEARLQRDVLDKKPTLVVIYIGINDVWHSQQGKGTPIEAYEAGLRRVIAAIQKAEARVVLCTPSVIGEKASGKNPLDAMLEEYSAISRRVAAESKAELLDLQHLFRLRLSELNTQDTDAGVLTTDGVHLNPAGNAFVAEQMLKFLRGGSSTAARSSSEMVRHVVLFKFKPVPQAEVDEVITAFKALPSKINAIAEFECGTDMSTENRAQGFTHCFLVTFRDATGRDAYLIHPAHQEFVQLAGPRIEDVLVFDFVR